MPRSNRPRRGGRPTRGGADAGPPTCPAPLTGLGGLQRSESHPDGEWVVRRVTGASTTKSYVCPGCSQAIGPGVPHVVAWPADDLLGADAALGRRRHWHPSCWQSRQHRRPR